MLWSQSMNVKFLNFKAEFSKKYRTRYIDPFLKSPPISELTFVKWLLCLWLIGWYEKLQSFYITILFGVMFYIPTPFEAFFIITCFWNFQNGGFEKKINLTVFCQYLPHFENFIEIFLSKFFKSNLWNQYFF